MITANEKVIRSERLARALINQNRNKRKIKRIENKPPSPDKRVVGTKLYRIG